VNQLLEKLRGGDMRSTGRADQVAAEVLDDPLLFDDLFSGMLCDEPLIRMRAADAVEKVTRERTDLLQPYRETIIQEVARVDQQEVRWHAAQLFPRLELSAEERLVVVGILKEYLEDKSRIVKTFSMQGLADLAEGDETLLPQVVQLLEELTAAGSPAMKSRGRKLLKELAKGQGRRA